MFPMKLICQLIFVFLRFLEGGVWSLRNLSISVPRAVLAGEGQLAVLRCSYDLEDAALYSIRWYRDEYEFYRYVPRELPPALVFPLPGAAVDLTRSDEHRVLVVGMHRQLSGTYLCEVSADAPLFHTDIRSAPLTVVDVPARAPQLSVDRRTYERGAGLRASCAVDAAYPPPNITWLLDDNKVAEMFSRRALDVNFKKRGVFSQLEITIRESESESNSESDDYKYAPHHHEVLQQSWFHHLHGDSSEEQLCYAMRPPTSGQFTVSCVAAIFDVYISTSDSIYIKENNPHPATVTRDESSGAAALYSVHIFVCVYAVLLCYTS